MEQNISIKDIQKRLQEPFSPDEIKFVIASKTKDPNKVMVSPYISVHSIQQRLDDVVGIENWQNEYKTWIGDSQLCGISICINGNWTTKWDGAQCTDIEKIKGGLSSAFKRAAKQWGIGRYLSSNRNMFATCELRNGKPYIPESEKKRLQRIITSQDKDISAKESNLNYEEQSIENSSKEFIPNTFETSSLEKAQQNTVSAAILKQIKAKIEEKGYDEVLICNKFGVIQLEHLSAKDGIDCLKSLSIA